MDIEFQPLFGKPIFQMQFSMSQVVRNIQYLTIKKNTNKAKELKTSHPVIAAVTPRPILVIEYMVDPYSTITNKLLKSNHNPITLINKVQKVLMLMIKV